MGSIFVYGSMCQGQVHFGRISEFVSEVRESKIQGSAYLLRVGYPVVTPEGEDSVPGELWEIQESDTLWRLLDQYMGVNPLQPEKGLHQRLRRPIQRVGGVAEEAWVYLLNPGRLPKGAQRIEGGDWRTVMAQGQPLTAQLTERQATYIRRLGSSTGREIVPIDLQLYRELMGLEMIVDKGRRLALSPLGLEVFRYL